MISLTCGSRHNFTPSVTHHPARSSSSMVMEEFVTKAVITHEFCQYDFLSKLGKLYTISIHSYIWEEKCDLCSFIPQKQNTWSPNFFFPFTLLLGKLLSNLNISSDASSKSTHFMLGLSMLSHHSSLIENRMSQSMKWYQILSTSNPISILFQICGSICEYLWSLYDTEEANLYGRIFENYCTNWYNSGIFWR